MNDKVQYRRDIQSLRGIAVLLVLLHHAKVLPFQGGYLGVDIFFVISGFLITNLVARAVRSGTFSFADFYWRRARRLLPAVYATIAASVLLAPCLLTDLEMSDFVKQVFGALTFTANVVLWLQTGYFERAAELKPLLHMWSLSIEEQYYLILPAGLVFAPKRLWLPGAIALTILSLLVCVAALSHKPGAVFYLLPTRAWEMGFGSVLAIWSIGRRLPSAQLSVFGPMALLVIGWLWLTPVSRAHPGFDAFLACSATAILLAQPLSLLSRGVAAQVLAWVGDRSYSIYLVHWPVFAFLNSANIGGDSLALRYRVTGIVASLMLASLLYWAVEHRFRVQSSAPRKRSDFVALIACTLPLCLLTATLSSGSHSLTSFGYRLRTNFGLSQDCESVDAYVTKATCATSVNPEILVWGDSYAMHFVQGLAESVDSHVAQATRSTCAPILGTALYAPPSYGVTWAKSCTDFNDAVLRSLSNESSAVQVVVLSSQWSYLLDASVMIDGVAVENIQSELIVARTKLTIEAIRALGKRVVIVAPPPGPGFDAGRCNERLHSGKWSFGGTPDCQFELDKANLRSQAVLSLLEKISREASVDVITFEQVLCSDTTNRCATRWGDTVLYRDVGHLSYEGSVALAKKMKLGRLVEQSAH